MMGWTFFLSWVCHLMETSNLMPTEVVTSLGSERRSSSSYILRSVYHPSAFRSIVSRAPYSLTDRSWAGLDLAGATLTGTDECTEPLDVILIPGGKCSEAVYLATVSYCRV